MESCEKRIVHTNKTISFTLQTETNHRSLMPFAPTFDFCVSSSVPSRSRLSALPVFAILRLAAPP
jgi:hypothetical protein